MPRLFLIDTFGFIFRAYHARARSGAPPMRTHRGFSTEAVYIFHNMLRKLLETYHPEYVAAVFESLGPTFRDEKFAAYKANRAETPPDLLEQIPYVRQALEAFSIPVLEFDRFEADDVIGTLARRAAERGFEVVIVSSDKDMLQLVTDRIAMLNPMKDDKLYDIAAVEEYMGVKPWQVADLLALKGDAVDNIPGAPGIGDKGARDLIRKFGSVEAALARAAEVERPMYRKSLAENRERIELSKELATIHTDVPLAVELESLAARPPDRAALKALYKELEFFSLLKDLEAGEQPAAPRDYATLSAAEGAAWLASLPAEAVLAIALGPADELGGRMVGLSPAEGVGRALPLAAAAGHLARVRAAHDAKSLIVAFRRAGLEPPPVADDTMLYGFLLAAEPSGASLDVLTEVHLDRALTADLAEQADLTGMLARKLRADVERQGLRPVYDTIDAPLSPVLAAMELAGIRIEPAALASLSVSLDAEIAALAARIYELAGKNFNINSPQQLSKVLYEDLGLAPARAPRGKAPSTAADVLETLAADHEIARKVLEYRQLTKLKGTYVDALPALIDPRTGRVHTTFNPAGAATGRLSSSNPNLQNIPIRTALGREIRAAFVPEPGWTLLVADYSQIELRLLAHLSRDPVLTEAFRNGEDIHTRTAAEVFGVPPLLVTPEQRRAAKAVNFGIVYGQRAFGLAQSLGISRSEAEQYIKAYFERYSGVRKWLDATIAEVRRTGFARTIFGRRRPIPDMNSRNPNARGFAERTAVNTPLQGAAADLIKLAMIRIAKQLEGFAARLLLQVHDELVLEAPPAESAGVRAMVKREMESVHRLEVPLVVDIGEGPNWRDAK
jgi:DNA polymerase-1